MTYGEWGEIIKSGLYQLDLVTMIPAIMADWKADRESRECKRDRCKHYDKPRCVALNVCARGERDLYEPPEAE
jgi:hypothetical protein